MLYIPVYARFLHDDDDITKPSTLDISGIICKYTIESYFPSLRPYGRTEANYANQQGNDSCGANSQGTPAAVSFHDDTP